MSNELIHDSEWVKMSLKIVSMIAKIMSIIPKLKLTYP